MKSFREFVQEDGTPVNSGFGTAGVLDTYTPLMGKGKIVRRKPKRKPAEAQPLQVVPRLRGIPV